MAARINLNKILLLIVLGFSSMVLAQATDVRVMALFTDKAMLAIDGNNILFKKGEEKQGVKLISASGRSAVVRMPDGRVQTVTLNQTIGSAYRKPQRRKLTVYSGEQGMFMLSGSINRRRIRFILDTGASFISMSSQLAERLKLKYQQGRMGRVQTASGTVPVWHVKLEQVKVGGITVANVDAVVLPGANPPNALLGMSFLKHVKMQRNGNAMILEQKY